MFRNRNLSWLREDRENRPWRDWRIPIASRPTQRIQWRDVVVVDQNNEFVAVQNLTFESLNNPANRTRLTNVIRAAATINDTDIDGLPDAWEQSTIGSIDAAADTPLPSGNPALLAYALSLGTDHPQPHLAPATGFVEIGDETHQTVTFRRRLGLEAERLVYQPERSTDGGRTWSTSAGDWVEHETREPYDGTGTEIVTLRSTAPVSADGVSTIVRIRVIAPD